MDTTYLSWPFLEDRHRQLAGTVGGWCRGRAFSHGGDVRADCRALVMALGSAGFLRQCVPAAWGGANASLEVRSLALCREQLAYADGLVDFCFAMQGLGSGPISLFGDDRQRRNYLPAVAAGEKLAAFALSEDEAGSDVASLTTQAVKDGNEFVIDGEKCWISNGGIADFYIVFARTGEAPGSRGISAFIVDATTTGLDASEQIDTIAPHPLARLRLRNCRIPASQLIGEPGKGFRIAMATLDVFRTTVAAAALGFMRRAADEAIAHARNRQLFGAPLADMQLTQATICDMAIAIDSSALLIYRAAWAKDSGQQRITREAAMAKLHATESAQRVIDAAVQMFGGRGVVSGHIAERLYREIRSLRIYEGASEVQKMIIAGQVLAEPRK